MDIFRFVELRTLKFKQRDRRTLWRRLKDWWRGREYCAVCDAVMPHRSPSKEEKLLADAPMASLMSYRVCMSCETWYVYGIDGLISVRTSIPGIIDRGQ